MVVQKESEEVVLAAAVEVEVEIVGDSMPFPATDRLQQPFVVGASYEVSGPIEPREPATVVQMYTWVHFGVGCH
jgi:hypothetical protein